jgi:EmrB/QacA subfamily drug resistance transporter
MTTLASRRSERLVLATLCAAQFLVVLDISIVNVALPAIRDDFSLAPRHLQWVISAYAVTFGGFLLLAGRLSDLRGSRSILIAGLTLFGACSLLCGLAWDTPSLLAGRALQGLGAAMISPAALGALLRAFPEGRERTRALGLWGAVGAVAASAGALFGGVIVQYASWRWVFLVNVPAVIAAVAIAWRLLTRSERTAHRRVDAVAATLLTAGLAALVAAFAEAGSTGWDAPSTSIGFAAAVLLVSLYGRREARSADPLLPLAAFRAPALVAANVAGVVLGAVMLASLLLLTVGMQSVLGLSAIATGAGIFAARGSGVLWTPVATRLSDRFGAPALLATGMAVMTAAFLLLGQLPEDATFGHDFLPALLLLGFAIPALFLSVTKTALGSAPREVSGVASALLSTSIWLGGAVGVAVAASFVGAEGAVAGDAADGVRAGFQFCAVLAGGGLLIGLGLAGRPALRWVQSAAEVAARKAAAPSRSGVS